MAEIAAELNERFDPSNGALPEEVLGELQSILRLHSTTPQELFYKWESYSMKMGSENVRLDVKTVRDFKKDIHEALERETRAKHAKTADRRGAGATPRNARGGDMFGLIDGVSPGTPRASAGVNGPSKRKATFDTPAHKASKLHAGSSPHEPKDVVAGQSLPFSKREKAGEILETLNERIPAVTARQLSSDEPRIKLKANTDLKKFEYKPMGMKLSEASEILDDRIESFLELVQMTLGLDDGAFGNPATIGTSEIIAVGRIASDSGEARLNASSIVLETSRRMGSAFRVPLKLDGVPGFDFFPGKIVALKGTNASGEYFSVSEILELPSPVLPGTAPHELDAFNARLANGSDETPAPLNIIVSSGPYTADTNLDFEPLHELCEKAVSTGADALILLGPFLDLEHPLLASGQLPPLPPSMNIDPDEATMTDVFKGLISLPLNRLCQSLKTISIIMVPSVRDAISKHVSWPQDRLKKAELGLPRQVAIVPNPVMISLNEMMFGICSQDVLSELRHGSCTGGNKQTAGLGMFERLSKHIIEQRHFLPVFPTTPRDSLPRPTPSLMDWDAAPKATGAMLDISYLALGEWRNVRPDVLITPSALTPFARVVDSVVCINPGTLSKKRGAGTFAQMTIEPRQIASEERDQGDLAHKVYERARVDVVRI